MCGRVAFSYPSIEKAKEILLEVASTVTAESSSTNHGNNDTTKAKDSCPGSSNINASTPCSFIHDHMNLIFQADTNKTTEYDNWNLSPGMKSVIFHADNDVVNHGLKEETRQPNIRVKCAEKIWGIVPKSGSKNNPLPAGPSKHFSNLMFNARSDTLYEKQTFRDLVLHKKRSCIWAIDGYYEWKVPDGDVLDNKKTKQPYFVYRKDGRPLFIAGLWTSVLTGKNSFNASLGTIEEETLETFTIITTDAKPSLRWLHHRQPVFIDNVKDTIKWLTNPTKSLLEQISSHDNGVDEVLSWHPVTKSMSNVNYRNEDCKNEIKIAKVPSIKSWFGNDTCSSKNKIIKTENNTNEPYSNSGFKTTTKQNDIDVSTVMSRKRKHVNEDENNYGGKDISSPNQSIYCFAESKRKTQQVELIDLTGDTVATITAVASPQRQAMNLNTNSPKRSTPKMSPKKQSKNLKPKSPTKHQITNYFQPRTTK